MGRKRHSRRPSRHERDREETPRRSKIASHPSLKSSLQDLEPQTDGQAELMDAIDTHDITICDGPAGTGKTLISFWSAIRYRISDPSIMKIVIVRPTLQSGEDDPLGHLPGDLNDKMGPFIAPFLKDSAPLLIKSDRYVDALDQKAYVQDVLLRLDIEIVPLAYMRGRTFNNSFIILDEAQNCTKSDFKLFLTRIGKDAKVIIEGDSTQSDREDGYLEKLQDIMGNFPEVAIVKMRSADIIRNPLIAKILVRFPD